MSSAISSMKLMMPNDERGLPRCGDTCSSRMLFIPNQPRKASGTRNRSQTKPAFCSQVSAPAGILPISVPLEFSRVIDSPPNRAKVMLSGTRICIVVTPKLPSPAFSPRARPCCLFG